MQALWEVLRVLEKFTGTTPHGPRTETDRQSSASRALMSQMEVSYGDLAPEIWLSPFQARSTDRFGVLDPQQREQPGTPRAPPPEQAERMRELSADGAREQRQRETGFVSIVLV